MLLDQGVDGLGECVGTVTELGAGIVGQFYADCGHAWSRGDQRFERFIRLAKRGGSEAKHEDFPEELHAAESVGKAGPVQLAKAVGVS